MIKHASEGHNGTSSKAKRPRWWNEGYETEWTRAKEAVTSEWDTRSEVAKQIEGPISEEALAFGHGARMAYQKIEGWGEALERELQRDWNVFANGVDTEWEKVKSAVKHGWERGKTAMSSKQATTIPPQVGV